jgi:hypothetical protein
MVTRFCRRRPRSSRGKSSRIVQLPGDRWLIDAFNALAAGWKVAALFDGHQIPVSFTLFRTV